MNNHSQRDTKLQARGDRIMNRTHIKTNPLMAALAASLLGLASTNVTAVEFQRGELSGSFDTTISYGASWRMDDADPDNLGKAHWRTDLGYNPTVGLLGTNAQQRAALGRWSVNSDDGNANYDKHDLISHAVKVTAELDLNWRNFGAFFRATGFHDFENHDAEFLSERAKELVGEDTRMLDAYIWGDHEVGEHFVSWRLGRQVVSWGESSFIQGGINVINPVDVSKLRVAGAELKEAFLPINMGWLTFDLTPNLSVEAVAMFEWEEIDPDPAGSFFSTNDFATPGGSYAMLSFGTVPQPVINQDLYQTVCLGGNLGASDIGLPPALVGAGCAVALPRGPSNLASESGQYGIALRYFSPELNDTEFGLYYLNYHSRLPLISGTAATSAPPPIGINFGATYFTEYPEDISLIGLSFNTTIGTYSVAGEISYRRNVPLQIDDVEVLFSGLSPLNNLFPEEVLHFKSQLGEFAPGEYIRGWDRHDLNQGQVTIVKLFGPNNPFRADSIGLGFEVGATYIPSLPAWSTLRYNGPGTDTGGGPDFLTGAMRNPETQAGGFADDFSWGYRFITTLNYNNAIGAWTVSPRLGFNHDVSGTSPGPGGNFVDGRKQVTVGVGFNYLQEWIVDLSFTKYSGAGTFNELRDRDFFSASVRYSF
jgi:hypothetical protein